MIRFICDSYLKQRWMVKAKVFHPSLERLADLSVNPAGVGEDVRSREFSLILQNLRVNGVWKWTGGSRLIAMDKLLCDCITEYEFPEVRMQDVGASCGITSLDTLRHLQKLGCRSVRITLLDRDTRLLKVRVPLGALYCTSMRDPFLIQCGRIGLYLQPMEGLEGLAWNWLARLLAARFRDRMRGLDDAAFESISLIDPAVAECPAITVAEGNLFAFRDDWAGSFNVIRASNVLNRSYFSDDQIVDALGILHRYLEDGGLLAVSRNEIGPAAEVELGAVWKKDGDAFVRIRTMERSPEIAGIIDSFRNSANA